MAADIVSPDFWIAQWEATIAENPRFRRQGYAGRRMWDRMSSEYGKEHTRGSSRESEVKNLITMLIDRGLLDKNARVLDIGCGTGRMSAPFTKHGAHVVALDFSQGMLDRLRESVAPDTADRIEIVEANWEEIDLRERGWEHSFDLVFASMTPAICTPDSFLKLVSASRFGCYFRGWAGKRKDSLLEEVWAHLLGEPMPRMGWDIVLAFNLLHAMDFSPIIEFQDVCWERKEPIDKAAQFFADFFRDLVSDNEEILKKRIVGYLQAVAEDGLVIRRTEGRTGAMTWKVR